MASNQELTDQIIALNDQVKSLSTRLLFAEGNASMQAQGGSRGGEGSVFDKKRLYPKELKDSTSFRSWSERFIAWLSMDNEEIGSAFLRAGKQEDSLDYSGLTVHQLTSPTPRPSTDTCVPSLKCIARPPRSSVLSVERMGLRRGGSLFASLIRRTQKSTQLSLSTSSRMAPGIRSSHWETSQRLWINSKGCLMTMRSRLVIVVSMMPQRKPS